MIETLLQPKVQAYIEQHLYDDAAMLLLKGGEWGKEFHQAVVAQIISKRKAAQKLPLWFEQNKIVYPTPLSMEQCSSEITARYKAQQLKGKTLVDLTGGLGVDTYFLSQGFEETLHVEQDATLSEIARHNFQVLGAKISCLTATAETHLKQMLPADWIYIDPARRSVEKQKVIALADYSPNVLLIKDLLLKKARRVLIKVSPMMDLKRLSEQLPELDELWVITVKNEVKEVLVLLGEKTTAPVQVRCVHLESTHTTSFTFDFAEEQKAEVNYGAVQAYLYEPHAGLMKAGAFKTIAARFGLTKLHPHTHLYTSKKIWNDFPGRTFEVLKVLPVRKKALQAHLPELKAHLTIRNFPMSVADLRKKLNLQTGGDHYAFATTDTTGKHLLLTRKAK